ncbi:DUF1592 domain-containing protein [Candidatus Laterigemmans baculatus]|uniref:DUF1592 domain-containing protein n=1 Tax=Candidatus Laterigemmans baculatus TaxID=2770505 RepID=UPI0013D93BEC|nr:DUF1592 domain-containing protein [Candidatus Laterigemmans baculatus]
MFAGLVLSDLLGGELSSLRSAAAAEPRASQSSDEVLDRGEAIYRSQCAACHGAEGEGSEASGGEPLHGDHPLPELAKIITDTMPEDDPAAIVDADAEAVAAYIHQAFYSPAAQLRNAPPRIELTRLTVKQYRTSVADIVAGFRGRGVWKGGGGLDGEYYNGKNFRSNKLRLERKDAEIDFDFETASPLPDKISDKEFAIRWRGGLFAPQTGFYEFIVESDCGFKLSINDTRTPLIDRWVKSGDATEFRSTLFLIGGRPYPIELETFKYSQKTARIALRWKPPEGTEEVIPRLYLGSGSYPETLAVATKFPPDDESTGYARGTSISREWDEAATLAAIEVADKVIADLDRLANLKAKQGGSQEERLRRFAQTFAKRAFRRPLSDSEKAFFVDASFEASEDDLTAVRRSILLTLKSPRFLYPGLSTHRPSNPESSASLEPTSESAPQLDGYAVMSRLALTLWDSIPDDAMLEAAAEGSVDSPEAVSEWAERMLDDPRTRAKTREFFEWWLMFDHFAELPKDRDKFGEFNAAVATDLKRSLELHLDDLVWEGDADFRKLLTSDELYVNDRLAKLYGIELSENAGFEKREVDPQQRAGILSHPLLMAGFAYQDDTSPIHRGVFLTRNVIGRTLRSPPQDFTPLPAELHADLSTRERVALQTEPAECQKCHAIINPLGFALENYDAIGRYRTSAGDKPIDASGWYQTLDGKKETFTGVRPLAEFLANHQEVHDTFIHRVFQHFVKQPLPAYGKESFDRLRNEFAASDFNIRQLLIEVATVSATEPSEMESLR